MDGIEDNHFKMDSFDSSDNFEDCSLKKVLENIHKDIPVILTAVLQNLDRR